MRLLLITVLLSGLALGQTVGSDFFGLHVNRPQTPWPTVQFGTYRLWDDGTAWTTLNPAKGVYKWAPLDNWVARAQNVQLIYTFGRTPAWASSAPSTACNYGNGQCVAPADYANWDSFVTAIATRYKGKIKYYELWNEPNDTGFWKGTTAQMVEMARRASQIIHSVEPQAVVISPGATWTATTAWAWLDAYLNAGAAPYIDVIGVHGYTGNSDASSILTIIDNIQNTQTAHGLNLPIIVTEGGWGLNTVIPDQNLQAAFLVQRYLLVTSRPQVKGFYWYQWDNPNWGTLWNASGMTPAGSAYGDVSNRIIGSTPKGCGKSGSNWACGFSLKDGTNMQASWQSNTYPVFFSAPNLSVMVQ